MYAMGPSRKSEPYLRNVMSATSLESTRQYTYSAFFGVGVTTQKPYKIQIR